MKASTDRVPENFQLDRITVPTSLHYSNTDPTTSKTDINRLVSALNGTKDLYVQKVNDYNHFDFAVSRNAAEIVYSKILCFFEKHTS